MLKYGECVERSTGPRRYSQRLKNRQATFLADIYTILSISILNSSLGIISFGRQ